VNRCERGWWSLAQEKPRFGYRRLPVLLGRRKPLGARPSANQEWALDFLHDAVECGRAIRVLSVVDAYTRECLALEVDTSFVRRRVTRVLDAIVAERGQPQAIRYDNGPEPLTERKQSARLVKSFVLAEACVSRTRQET